MEKGDREMSLITERRLEQLGESVVAKSFNKTARQILNEQIKDQRFDVFISHSYNDAKKILGLKKLFESYNYSAYVDWIDDRQLSRGDVNKETAYVLRKRMNNCKSLVYATSINSSNSKWMPWELGYFDGVCGKAAIMPITSISGRKNYEGIEYLSLYPYIREDMSTQGNQLLWVFEDNETYTTFQQWLRE
jgi:hypothetical protein